MNREADLATYVGVLEDLLAEATRRYAKAEAVLRCREAQATEVIDHAEPTGPGTD